MSDDIAALRELYGEKLSELLRHVAHARLIRQYDFNNTYQYIINREETQLSWLARAITELGATVSSDPVQPEAPAPKARRDAKDADRLFEEDAREAAAFAERWRPRADALTDARHRGTVHVILGETLEQKRFFEQALAGQTDLLGKRTAGVGARVGEVLSTRWIE